MTLTGTIELIGRTKNAEETFFQQSLSVSSEQRGQLLDELVEASYELYYALNMWLLTNKAPDYELSQHSWYITVSSPSFYSDVPYEGNSLGSSIDHAMDIVQTVAHWRHLQISMFIEGHINYLRDGYYKSYVEGMHPLHNFYDIFHTRDVQFFRDYGYSGTQLDTLLSDMGEDYQRYLRDYQHYQELINPALRKLRTAKAKDSTEKQGESQGAQSFVRRLFTPWLTSRGRESE